jgi:hypothetical protein
MVGAKFKNAAGFLDRQECSRHDVTWDTLTCSEVRSTLFTITIPTAVCKNETTVWKVTLRDSSVNLVDGLIQMSPILTEI